MADPKFQDNCEKPFDCYITMFVFNLKQQICRGCRYIQWSVVYLFLPVDIFVEDVRLTCLSSVCSATGQWKESIETQAVVEQFYSDVLIYAKHSLVMWTTGKKAAKIRIFYLIFKRLR